jgi:hypothetical protein
LEEKYNGYFSSGFLKIVYKENFKRKGRGRRGNYVSLQKLNYFFPNILYSLKTTTTTTTTK